MRDFNALLQEKKILVSDGAWGTEMSKIGLQAGESPELWNLEQRDKVLSVAKSYVDAGSDLILTNSFGGSRFKLEKVGLAEKLADVNRAAAEISREAAGDNVLVCGSLGPTGEFMEPLGTYSEADMIAAFSEQAGALAEGGADLIVIETMADLGEVTAALKGAKEAAGLPVITCLSYQKGPGGIATMMGVRPDQAAEELAKAGADVIGSNCGTGYEDMIEIVRLMRSATDLPLWAKANAGLPELVNGETVFRQSPEEMAALVPQMIEAGANVVGGCCGSTPAHIAAIAKSVQALRAG